MNAAFSIKHFYCNNVKICKLLQKLVFSNLFCIWLINLHNQSLTLNITTRGTLPETV